MQELIPTNALGNPFDLTGLLYNEEGYGKVLDRYLESPLYDTILVISSMLGPTSAGFNAPLIEPLRRAAGTPGKRLIVASTTAGALGEWTETFLDAGVAVGRGIVPTVRSLKAMDTFVARQHRRPAPPVTPMDRPAGLRTAVDHGQEIVSFGDAAAMASTFGLPMAPHALVETPGDLTAVQALGDCDAYVVKLADVLHRSDIGAVATGVTGADLPAIVVRMAELASVHGLAPTVVVQPELHAPGEVFLGASSTGDLGTIVLFGLGGVFVELLGDTSARLAPITSDDARDMLDEIKGRGVLAGARGSAGMDIEQLVQVVVAFAELAAATSGWLESIEINPLLAIDGGFAAVDLSCVLRAAPVS